MPIVGWITAVVEVEGFDPKKQASVKAVYDKFKSQVFPCEFDKSKLAACGADAQFELVPEINIDNLAVNSFEIEELP